ncbi:MAG: LysR family transcriptional regulator [Paracoccaceae bacterium]|nr:LysR family transcriptional regulator [Paracoccaceae bacterium]
MKILQLKLFVAVYEEGSFSAGAVRMNATQSGLSMHVRQLEQRYNVSLLERTSTGVIPTEAGRRFYKAAIEALRTSAHAEDTLKELAGVICDDIHIGLMPAFTVSILSPVLLRFTREYPYVRVTIQEAYSGQLSKEVASGKLDFAVVPAYYTGLNLTAAPMGRDRECLVCSGQNRLVQGRRAVLSALPPQKLVLPSAANVRRARMEQYLSVNNIEVASIMELDSMPGTLNLIAQSDWVSVLPSILSLQDRDGIKRIFTPLDAPPMPVDYIRIAHRARPLNRAAQAFSDIFQEELNNGLESTMSLGCH